jgi:hypothetical protein
MNMHIIDYFDKYVTSMREPMPNYFGFDTIGKIDDDISFVLSYSCQEKMNQEIDNNNGDWLRLESVLQNVQGKDISTMTALLEKKNLLLLKSRIMQMHYMNMTSKTSLKVSADLFSIYVTLRAISTEPFLTLNKEIS